MGLIKAAAGAVGGTLADQWKEYFYCDSLDQNILVVKGQKKTSGRSFNKKGSDNVISDGSGIAVADGQCMMIVEQGKIVDICAESGVYTYDNSSEPSIFSGDLGDSIMNTFAQIGKRFTFGGEAGNDQRVYYFNTKEIMDNKFGTANPFIFRVVDKRVNLDREVSVRCNGIFSYRITNPLIFYTNVCGNVEYAYDREEIDKTLKGEFISALQPAFAKLSDLELRPSEIPSHAMELEEAMNEVLTKKWSQMRGISVVSVALNPITLRQEDLEAIQKFQDSKVLTDPSMAAATLVEAQAKAMEKAAGNPNGSMMGFMGMGMASQAGGADANALFQQAAAQQAAVQQMAAQQGQKIQKPSKSSWICSCGTENTGKFCSECGAPRPQQTNGWICSCGAVNKGKFCVECGAPKPAGALLYRCDKCGWEPEDPAHPPKFCPECGDPFTADDIQK